MSTPPEMRGVHHDMPHTQDDRAALQDRHAGSGHGWMMWLMCLPMVIFAIVLMTTTAAGAAALVPAILCVAMMALMMRMHGGSGGH